MVPRPFLLDDPSNAIVVAMPSQRRDDANDNDDGKDTLRSKCQV
jgi:hypothetical protein